MLGIKKVFVNGRKYLYVAGLRIPYQTKQCGASKWFCIGKIKISYHISSIFYIPLPWRESIWNIQHSTLQKQKSVHYHNRALWENPQRVQQRLEEIYEQRLGKRPNLHTPRTLTEKLNWLKLHYRNHLVIECCDKYSVKAYIAHALGCVYHVPTLGVWTAAKDIDFSSLPNSFVLKVNWSSGYNIFIEDKKRISNKERKRILALIDYWMQPMCNSYYDSFNWAYKDIVPVVYAEEYLDTSSIVQEYKVFCFHGKPEFVLIEQNAGEEVGSRVCVDLEGRRLPFRLGTQPETYHYHLPGDYVQMLRLAEILSEPFPFVRIDFLGTEQRRMIGEMTFYSGGGYSMITPDGWDERLGDLLQIQKEEWRIL